MTEAAPVLPKEKIYNCLNIVKENYHTHVTGMSQDRLIKNKLP